MSSQPLQEIPESVTQDKDEQLPPSLIATASKKASLLSWCTALKQIFSCYLAIHLAFLVTTLYSVLFILKDFSAQALPLELLWSIWARKDAGHFRYIALFGYTDWWRTAFFPLYPHIGSTDFLSFIALHNLLDLVPDLFMLVIVLLSFVGPWRMPSRFLSYSLYALVSYVFFQLFPVMNAFPLTSVPRFLLELFPAFIVLAGIGKHRGFNLNYLLISCALLFFMLIQFLTGHWIT